MIPKEIKLTAKESNGYIISAIVQYPVYDELTIEVHLTIPQLRMLNIWIAHHNMNIRDNTDLNRIVAMTGSMADLNPELFIIDETQALHHAECIMDAMNVQNAMNEKETSIDEIILQ